MRSRKAIARLTLAGKACADAAAPLQAAPFLPACDCVAGGISCASSGEVNRPDIMGSVGRSVHAAFGAGYLIGQSRPGCWNPKGAFMPSTIAARVSTKPEPDAATVDDIKASIRASMAARRSFSRPYRHSVLENLFPAEVADGLAELPFAAPSLDGVSGKRELHNDTRRYFDAATMAEFPVVARVAEALQATDLVADIA